MSLNTSIRKRTDEGSLSSFFLKFWQIVKGVFINEDESFWDKEKEEPKKEPEIDYRAEEIKISLQKISKIESFYKKTKLSILKDVVDITQIIHDVIVKYNIKYQKLSQFHMYYTDHYIPLIEKIIKTQDEKIDYLKKMESNTQTKIDNCDKRILDINNKIKSHKLNEANKSKYETNIIKLIGSLFDNHVISSSSKKLETKDCWIMGDLKGEVSINLVNDTIPSGSTYVTEPKKIRFAKVHNHWINESILESIYNNFKDVKYVDSYNHEPIFSFKNGKETIFIIIYTKKNTIDKFIYDKKTQTNQDIISSLENEITLIEIEKESHIKEKNEYKNSQLFVNLDDKIADVLTKYIDKLKKYHEEIEANPQDTQIERETLSNVMDIEMTKF
jgi:hypothetical protein